MAAIFDRYRVIEVDTHVSQPPGLWTARVSSRWGDRVRHMERVGTKDIWRIGDEPVVPTDVPATVGFDDLIPLLPDALAGLAQQSIAKRVHQDAARLDRLG